MELKIEWLPITGSCKCINDKHELQVFIIENVANTFLVKEWDYYSYELKIYNDKNEAIEYAKKHHYSQWQHNMQCDKIIIWKKEK